MPQLIVMRGITKVFPGTVALRDVDFDADAGEICGLVGENGAGKSTLMRILAGMFSDYEGHISVAGHGVRLTQPRLAQEAGIALVHQELSLVPEMTVAENIMLGREYRGRMPGTIDKRQGERAAAAVFEQLGVRIDPRRPVRVLSTAQRQLVEIAKGVLSRPRVLIMDEPTTSLTLHEVQDLFRLLRLLHDQGMTVIYISHKLEEVLSLTERITVLRDGRLVASRPTTGWTVDDLCRAMVGRTIVADAVSQPPGSARPPILQVRGLTRKGFFHDISFDVRPGEIVGLAGLIGAGRTEIAEAIFGLRPADSGRIVVDGVALHVRHPRDAIAAGIALVADDRRRKGLIPTMSVGPNLTLRALKALSRLQFLDGSRERAWARDMVANLAIKTRGLRTPVLTLSGGNQQKVVVGRWLMLPSKVLLLDEPTVGIDVGAKAEIRRLIINLADSGKGILFISSELAEVLSISHRVLVIRNGSLVGEFRGSEATEEKVMAYAAGARTGARVVN